MSLTRLMPLAACLVFAHAKLGEEKAAAAQEAPAAQDRRLEFHTAGDTLTTTIQVRTAQLGEPMSCARTPQCTEKDFRVISSFGGGDDGGYAWADIWGEALLAAQGRQRQGFGNATNYINYAIRMSANQDVMKREISAPCLRCVSSAIECVAASCGVECAQAPCLYPCQTCAESYCPVERACMGEYNKTVPMHFYCQSEEGRRYVLATMEQTAGYPSARCVYQGTDAELAALADDKVHNPTSRGRMYGYAGAASIRPSVLHAASVLLAVVFGAVGMLSDMRSA